MRTPNLKETEIFTTIGGNFAITDEDRNRKDWLLRQSDVIKEINKHLKRVNHRLKSLEGAKNISEEWIDSTKNIIWILEEIKKSIENGKR